VANHYEYLQSRLELYKVYLENVRKGQSQVPSVSDKKVDKKNPCKKFPHSCLEENGVLAKVNLKLDKAKRELLKKCYYVFTMVSPGKFHVDVRLKKGIDVGLLSKPVELLLDELLRMQEHHQPDLDIDIVTLNVNLLVHLLNTNFMTKT